VQLLQGGVIIDSRPARQHRRHVHRHGVRRADTLLINYTTTAPAVGYFQRDINYIGNGGSMP